MTTLITAAKETKVEHDILNYQNRGLCYLPKPKAEADKSLGLLVKLLTWTQI